MELIWTDEKCFVAIQQFEDFCKSKNIHASRDLYQEWHKHTENTPSINAIEKKGSWNVMRVRASQSASQSKAEYEVRLHSYNKWSYEDCVSALTKIYDERKEVPTFRAYVQWSTGRSDVPSVGKILSCFGTWRKACIAMSPEDGIQHETRQKKGHDELIP